MKNFTKKICSVAVLALMLFTCIGIFTGCQSPYKTDAFFDTSGIEYTNFDYNANTNQTTVVWATTLTNNTIYDFDGFSVTFKLFSNSSLVNTQTYNYNRGVKHGGNYTGVFNFFVDGKIDGIEYVSWTAKYATFWDTYKIWFIVTIVVASVVTFIYIIIMIARDLALSDTVDTIQEFFEEHAWVAFAFLIPLAGTIWGIVTSYWVPVLIVLGGVVAFIVLSALAHLVKFIIECASGNASFGGMRRGMGDNEEYFDSETEDIEDYLDDKDTLMLFSVGQLKEYCRQNGIKG
ncbi:MAG: hypothetical protein K2N18_03785, partial [Clostridia bacterium]|nr:hypothetical protein [Clostridia bacterium]